MGRMGSIVRVSSLRVSTRVGHRYRAAVVDALKESELGQYVSENFNTQSLKAFVREVAGAPGLPASAPPGQKCVCLLTCEANLLDSHAMRLKLALIILSLAGLGPLFIGELTLTKRKQTSSTSNELRLGPLFIGELTLTDTFVYHLSSRDCKRFSTHPPVRFARSPRKVIRKPAP